MHAILLNLCNILAPSFCAHCHVFLSEQSIFCSPCKEKIKPIVPVYVALTPNKSMVVHAIGRYQEPLKTVIAGKFLGSRVASKQLGEMIGQLPVIREREFDLIVPIPLHWSRYAKRGFNQSVLMAQELSKQSGKPVVELLERVRPTAFQSQLAIADRKKNLNEVLALTSDATHYVGARLLLIDDLMTTGATLAAAGRVLLDLKPANVRAIVACRVI